MTGLQSGYQVIEALVESIDGTNALVRDSFGRPRSIRADVRRGNGPAPRVGEIWLLDTSLGSWTFAACLRSNPRQEASVTTPVLANGATWTGTIALGTAYLLLRIQTSQACRVRLYDTPAHRTADAPRAFGTDPTGDHGLMFDFQSGPSLLSATLSPSPRGISMEAPPSPAIPISITNRSGSAAVTVTLTHTTTE